MSQGLDSSIYEFSNSLLFVFASRQIPSINCCLYPVHSQNPFKIKSYKLAGNINNIRHIRHIRLIYFILIYFPTKVKIDRFTNFYIPKNRIVSAPSSCLLAAVTKRTFYLCSPY